MPEVRGWFRGLVVTAGMLLATVLALPAHAEPPGAESIPTYDVVLTIRSDGLLHVRETITYDFDRGGEHGIVRRISYRKNNRLFDIRDVRTSSSTGAPARAETAKLLHDVRIDVGDDRRRVHGRQAYVIEYDVAWAFTPYEDHDELQWDALGSDWDVPIGEAAVRVEGPVPLRRVKCQAGTAGSSTRCLRDRDGPFAVDFTQSGLRPRETMTIRVSLPKGAIQVSPPHYARPHWQGTWAGTAALALALAAVVLLARRPAPPYAGETLTAVGTMLIVADLADDILVRGFWAFSLGDGCLAGLALVITGAAAARTRRSRTTEHAAVTGLGD
ncbi:DUF2207 domain-containing protein [Actinomadura rudentiformis]|uniref:DUF2207 domain-containing protein n=1 Tax=Actinomadura rudentiformis TaxID=359158 RepID=A0A6H9YXL5_9ACTN|nr:DUF2207 domain-containing protein [Actinomadura rudentiformis]KAB2345947.1 DUF2207 domain-containing protein [Actinomadura rudentiformis]